VDPDITGNMLHALFQRIWNEGEMPNDWKCCLPIKIPKNVDTVNCDNWRGITLLYIPSKVFTRILLNRIKEHVNYRLRREQSDYRPNRSCINQINTLRIIIERMEWSSRLYAVYIDFEKSLDSVSMEAMWKEVKNYEMQKQLIDHIKETYRGYICRVVHEGCVRAIFCEGRSETKVYSFTRHVFDINWRSNA
jgi:sorting nexin-29